eukprot:6234842-Pyramimonas_sp.AAC.1
MGIQGHALSAGCRGIRIPSPHVSPDLLEAAHRSGMSMSERLRREKSTLHASGAVDHEQSLLLSGIAFICKGWGGGRDAWTARARSAQCL